MIVVFPNYAAKRANGSVQLEASHPLLLDALAAAFPRVGVAAAIDVSDDERTFTPLTNPLPEFIALGEIGRSTGRGARLLAYAVMLPTIVRALWRSDFSYIFLPGHVGLLACLCCVALRQPYGVYLRCDWHFVTPRVLRWLGPVLIRRARFAVGVGPQNTASLASLNPRTESVVPMSAVLSSDAPTGRAFAANGGTRVLFVGELLRTKGPYELIEAIGIAGERGVGSLSLSIVGAGPELARLRRAAHERGIGDRVKFLGLVTDPAGLAQLYCDHDVFCLPTYAEGFPRVLYEAMAFSMPIVTTRVGQIDSVIEDGLNGLFAAVRDPNDLAHQLIRLAADASLRRRLGEGARATVEPMLESWRMSTHGHQVARLIRQAGFATCTE